MKCCGSPITSTGRNDAGATLRATRDVAASFEALLVREAFAPLANAMGFYGDTVVAAAAQTMARAQRGGLTDRLERAMAPAAQPHASVAAGDDAR